MIAQGIAKALYYPVRKNPLRIEGKHILSVHMYNVFCLKKMYTLRAC